MEASEDGKRVYSALWPLPGGQGRFLATLLEILEWVDKQHQPAKKALHAWMRERYGLGTEAKTTDNYIQLVARMGYLFLGRGGKVAVTDRGSRLLQVRDAGSVLDNLLHEWLGVYDVLEALSQLGTANGQKVLARLSERYPSWTHTAQYNYRLQWLHSLGALEKADGGFVITPYGQQVLRTAVSHESGSPPRNINRSESSESHDQTSQQEIEDTLLEDVAPDQVSGETEAPLTVIRDEADRLADQLHRAAQDSSDSQAFEQVLTEAFRFLGFEAEHKGGPGDTDVLVTATLGQETYRCIVDGKSSKYGRVGNQQIDWLALRRHKDQHRAEYILVVAPSFSSGDLLDNASRTDAALLSADDLAAVTRLHASTPLSLTDLRELFRYAGHPELPLQRLQEKAAEVARLQRLMPDILRTFEHLYRVGVPGPIAADALHSVLASDYGRAVYSREEIVAGLDLLCTPLVGALRKVTESAYALQMPITSVGRRFQAQARRLLEASQEAVSGGENRDTISRIGRRQER